MFHMWLNGLKSPANHLLYLGMGISEQSTIPK